MVLPLSRRGRCLRDHAPELVNAAAGNPLGIDPRDAHGTDDIVSSTLVLPAGREVDLQLRSLDVIHGFFVPGMRLKAEHRAWLVLHVHFTPVAVGTYPILCSQVCGLGHARMQARLLVVSPADFNAWMAAGACSRGSTRAMKRISAASSRQTIASIGILYMYLALAAVTVGTVLSLLMRVHRVWPNAQFPSSG